VKIIHINQQDSQFGAYIAARRLHDEMHRQGHDSQLWVLSKTTAAPSVKALFGPNPVGKIVWRLADMWNNRGLKKYPKKPVYGWAASKLSFDLARRINRAKPDLVVLHEANCMLAHAEIARINAPVLVVFHDLHPFTGDCHYPLECGGFAAACGKCPQLGSDDKNDISHGGWRLKKAAWAHPRIAGVAPSRWMRDCAAASSVCHGKKIHHIPNGIPLDVFNPSLREKARAEMGFSDDCFYILAGAASLSDTRKGFHITTDAVKILAAVNPKIKLATFGAMPPKIPGVEFMYMGFIRDEAKMAALFSACDVFVHPTAADSFGLTLAESIACGTPCVTVPVGGCVDIVRDGVTGFVARDRSPEAVAEACGKVIDLPRTDYQQLRASCRAVAEAEYGLELMAKRYLKNVG